MRANESNGRRTVPDGRGVRVNLSVEEDVTRREHLHRMVQTTHSIQSVRSDSLAKKASTRLNSRQVRYDTRIRYTTIRVNEPDVGGGEMYVKQCIHPFMCDCLIIEYPVHNEGRFHSLVSKP